nr:MFS transporter [Nocardioides sp. MAH-18]
MSVQSVLFATGEGAFLTGSAVFFTQIVGLSAAQVGIGLTAAGAVSFCFAIPLGKLSDRVGPKRTWALSAFGTAGLYLLWPFIGGFATFVVLMVLLELVQSAGWSGRGAYTIDAFPHDERVRSMAFMRAALNIGFTLGAGIGGLALAFDSEAMLRAVPWLTAAVLVANAVLIVRLPDAQHDKSVAAPVEKAVATKDKRGSALRNRGFVGLMTCDGVLGTNQVLLNVVIPLWLVQETDAPHVLLAWLFGTNTVLAVLLQVPAARGVESVATSLRASRISAAFFVGSCLIVLVTHDTIGWVTIALVWLGHVTVTGAELFQSAGHWGFLSELSDPDRRGEYQGASQLGGALGSVWAPALFTFLAMEWGTTGWLLIGGIIAVAVLAMPAFARAAERYLVRARQPATA